MIIKGLSRLFSIWFIIFFVSFNLFQTPGFSQTQKDVEQAANKQDIEKLIKLYDKASKKNLTSIKDQIVRSIKAMNDPLIFDVLITALKNEHPQIRSAAATALGKMNDPRAVDSLILAINDTIKYVRQSITYALAETKDPRAVKALARGITYKNWQYTPPEWRALIKMGPMIEMPLIEALADEDTLVRGGAALALGDPKYTNAIEPLIAVLKDENINVRRLALLGLVRMKDSLTVEPLLSVALLDDDVEAKRIATGALLNLKDPRAVEIYIATLNSDDRRMQERAAAALLELDTPSALESHTQASIVLLNGEDEKMRMTAAKTLLNMKDPIPDDIRASALKVIDEESFIKLFTVYDQYQRKNGTSLRNTDGNLIAKQIYEYHDFNNMLISRTVTIDLETQDTLRITNYNKYGKPENYKYLCFDKQGNIIKKDSKPVLVELFKVTQKEKSKIGYVGFTKVKSYEERKIYPCQDCAEKTKIDNCRYVW